jgi:hypothetical protein
VMMCDVPCQFRASGPTSVSGSPRVAMAVAVCVCVHVCVSMSVSVLTMVCIGPPDLGR